MTLLVQTGLLVAGVAPSTEDDILTEAGDHLDTEADDPLVTEAST